ncbi:MAG: Hpt domain-containing protein, partial [Nannocystaceae bacterium]
NNAARDPLRVADPRTIDDGIPADIAELVGRMLAHGEHRRPSAEEFCARWERVSSQLRPRLRPRPRPGTPPPAASPSSGSVSAPPSFGSLPTTSTSQPPRTASGPRVMVVDANPITQHLVVGCLRRAGCRVRASADPREATRSSPGSVDLVVVSTEIPDADAIDIARYLQEYHPSEWVVFTGQGQLDDPMKEVGVRDLVGVPAGFERLSGLIDLLRGELTLRDSSRPTTIDAVDREALERLRDADPGILQEAIELFLGQTPESLARISESHARGDLKSVRDECRSLSTSARALGASHLARLAHAAAELVREGDHGCVPGFVTEMEREYGLVFSALMDVHSTT